MIMPRKKRLKSKWQQILNQIRSKLLLKKIKLAKGNLIITSIVAVSLLGLYLASRYLVIAWVDKQPISRFELYNLLDKQFGTEIREQLITERLILTEARKRQVQVAREEIEAEINKVKEQPGGEQQLSQFLQAQGLTQAEFDKIVKVELLKRKMFGKDIQISDEDVNKFIEENKAQLPEVTDKLKGSIKEQLKQRKISENYQNWLSEALQSARVSRL